jgi:hypothetical protein
MNTFCEHQDKLHALPVLRRIFTHEDSLSVPTIGGGLPSVGTGFEGHCRRVSLGLSHRKPKHWTSSATEMAGASGQSK